MHQIQRREWWLWLSALVVTLLATVAFLLSCFPGLFAAEDHYYEMRPEQAVWGTTALVLLFNTWMVYRQWSFRRERKQVGKAADLAACALNTELSIMDPVTGFYTRACLEQRLARETAFARRQQAPLSLVALHLEDFPQIVERFGQAAAEQVLKEFARRLKRATRGSDFGACLGVDDFLLVLPECGLAAAKLLSQRLGSLEMKCAGQDITLTYSAGWIDYQTGDLPANLLDRAQQILKLYKEVSRDTLSASLVAG